MTTTETLVIETTVVWVDVRCPHRQCQRKLARTTAPLSKVMVVTCPRCRETVTVQV